MTFQHLKKCETKLSKSEEQNSNYSKRCKYLQSNVKKLSKLKDTNESYILTLETRCEKYKKINLKLKEENGELIQNTRDILSHDTDIMGFATLSTSLPLSLSLPLLCGHVGCSGSPPLVYRCFFCLCNAPRPFERRHGYSIFNSLSFQTSSPSS